MMCFPLMALGLLLSTGGQEPSQEELRTIKRQKLAAPFLKASEWATDYDEARAQARSSGRIIFTYFTRTWPD